MGTFDSFYMGASGAGWGSQWPENHCCFLLRELSRKKKTTPSPTELICVSSGEESPLSFHITNCCSPQLVAIWCSALKFVFICHGKRKTKKIGFKYYTLPQRDFPLWNLLMLSRVVTYS